MRQAACSAYVGPDGVQVSGTVGSPMAPRSIRAVTEVLTENPPDALPRLLSILDATANQSAEERRDQTLEQLRRQLEVVLRELPVYRERFMSCISSAEELDWSTFERLPVLRREELMSYGRSLDRANVPEAFTARGQVSTSGSTGQPLSTSTFSAARVLAQAMQLRFQRWHGFDFNELTAFITTPTVPSAAHTEGKPMRGWAGPLGQGTALAMGLLAGPGEQLDWLCRKKPRYLATYPSNLLSLLQESRRTGRVPERIAKVVLSSEPVTSEHREMTREIWGADALGTYSASEVGPIGLAAPDSGQYFLQAENVYCEILRDDDTPCEPGEVGRVVVTTLQDWLRPLFRYEIGDYAEVARVRQDDSMALPRLGRVVGRERSMVRLPDGRRVWPYFELGDLVALKLLRQWQLVQKRDLTIEARVVPERELDGAELERIRAVVVRALPGVSVTVTVRAEIPRTARGKFLEFVSEL